MSVEIQALPGGLVQNAGDGPAGARPPAESVTAPPATVSRGTQTPDSVSLTDSATRMRELESGLGRLPVVDSRRVEEMQRQLATGSFTVNPVSSADKLLALERALA
jgi:negative regulator of flagellin synthesis FlgM